MELVITLIVVLFVVNLLIVRAMARRSRGFASEIHTQCAA
jgi:hypothetical protein